MAGGGDQHHAYSASSKADQNGVLVHVVHILVSLYAYNEVVLLQYYERDKQVYFFAHPWFLLGILVDLIGIIRYSTDKYNLEKFQIMNVASLFYCTLGIPCLAAHYHLMSGMPVKVAYAHLFLAILPYVLFRRRKYGPLYEVTRYTIIIACLSGLFGALLSFDALVSVAFALILYAAERVGTGPEIHGGLSAYHWFVVYLAAVNAFLALSLSPARDIYELAPRPASNALKYVRYAALRTPPVALFRSAMGREAENTREVRLLLADLRDAGWSVNERTARKGKRNYADAADYDGSEEIKGKVGGGKKSGGGFWSRGKANKAKTAGVGRATKGSSAGKAVKGGQRPKITANDEDGDEKRNFLSYLFGR